VVACLAGPWLAGWRRPRPTPARVELRHVPGATWREGEPLFVAVLGVDDEQDPGRWPRADALHVIAIAAGARVAYLVNIPRDTFVDIPGFGGRKINAAHELGGPELEVRCLRALTGFPIQLYARVGFASLRGFVDAIGGVTVDIPSAIAYDENIGRGFSAGSTRLDGADALRYLRTRHTQPGGDFARTTNQARFLSALVEAVRARRGRWARLGLGAAFFGHVATDLSPRELGRLARALGGIAATENETAPGRPADVDGQSVVFLDAGAGAFFAGIGRAVGGGAAQP